MLALNLVNASLTPVQINLAIATILFLMNVHVLISQFLSVLMTSRTLLDNLRNANTTNVLIKLTIATVLVLM